MFPWANSKSNHCKKKKKKEKVFSVIQLDKVFCEKYCEIHFCAITLSECFLLSAKISEITCFLHSFQKFDASRCSKCHNVVDDPIV